MKNKILFESPMRQNNTSSVGWRGKCPPDELWFGGIIFIIISWCETFCDTYSQHVSSFHTLCPHHSTQILRNWTLCHPHHHSTHYVVITCTLRDGRHTCHRSSACYIMLVPHTFTCTSGACRRTGRLCLWWLTMHEIRSETEIEGSCVERQRKRGR